MTDKNAQAFPRPSGGFGGLTKLEYFAALALQGMLANPEWKKHEDLDPVQSIEELAVHYAINLTHFLNEEQQGKLDK